MTEVTVSTPRRVPNNRLLAECLNGDVVKFGVTGSWARVTEHQENGVVEVYSFSTNTVHRLPPETMVHAIAGRVNIEIEDVVE